MANIGAVGDGNFQSEVLESDVPVLVDFWADWCGPCHRVAPEVEAVGSTFEGRLRVLKLNIDDNPRTAMLYHVQSIPTLLLFSGGEVVARIVGAVPRQMITNEVEPHLAAASTGR